MFFYNKCYKVCAFQDIECDQILFVVFTLHAFYITKIMGADPDYLRSLPLSWRGGRGGHWRMYNTHMYVGKGVANKRFRVDGVWFKKFQPIRLKWAYCESKQYLKKYWFFLIIFVSNRDWSSVKDDKRSKSKFQQQIRILHDRLPCWIFVRSLPAITWAWLSQRE